MAIVSPSLHFASPGCSLRITSFLSPSIVSTNPFCASHFCLKCSMRNQVPCLVLANGRRRTELWCSVSSSSSAGLSESWILEPTGCYFHFSKYFKISSNWMHQCHVTNVCRGYKLVAAANHSKKKMSVWDVNKCDSLPYFISEKEMASTQQCKLCIPYVFYFCNRCIPYVNCTNSFISTFD
jgi:hypothetical protein